MSKKGKGFIPLAELDKLIDTVSEQPKSDEPAYQSGDHVRCEAEGNLFIGRVTKYAPLGETFVYEVNAELPSGDAPLVVQEKEIIGKL